MHRKVAMKALTGTLLAGAIVLAFPACTSFIGLGETTTVYGDCIGEADCNDGDTCTLDRCGNDAKCKHDPNPECTTCETEEDCQQKNCSVTSCEGGFCRFDPFTAGAPANTQTEYDCLEVRCLAQDEATEEVPDDQDVEDDGDPCTVDVCKDGEPTHDKAALGTSCSIPAFPTGVCDESGQCVECTTNEHCPTVDGKPAICIGKTCFPATCGDMMPAGGETDVDCGGVCPPCANELHCLDDTDCMSGFCDEQVCKPCVDDGDCALQNFCESGVCTKDHTQGEACATESQCETGNCVDGFCCDTPCTGLCKACAAEWTAAEDGTCANVGFGKDPKDQCAFQDVATCGTTGACNGMGICELYSPGAVCGAASCLDGVAFAADACNSNGVCAQGATTNCANDGKICVCMCDNMPCGPAQTCDDAMCADCMTDGDCTGTPAKFCDMGTCKTKLPQGAGCSSPNQCSTGSCADGICCDSACTGPCQACTAAKKGAPGGVDGLCGNISISTDPDNECSDLTSCNGAGACGTQLNGSVCAANGVCASGFCVDGVCCDTQCNTLCQACTAAKKGSGSDGTCSVIAANFDPDSECAGAQVCNGSGVCGLPNGGACLVGTDCVSGHCTDGLCCGTACLGPCEACDVSGSSGTCTFILAGDDPDNECPGVGGAGSVCGGDATCKGDLGETCLGGAADCASGHCADDVCCNSECSGSCDACSTAAGAPVDGTCANVDGAVSPSCIGYYCKATSANCPNTCTLESDCLPGYFCSGVGGGSGQCKLDRLLLLTTNVGSSTIHGSAYPAGGAWATSTSIGGAVTIHRAGLAVDGTGRGMALVRDNDQGDLRFTLWDGTNWGATFTDVSTMPATKTNAAPAVDADPESNVFHVVYQSGGPTGQRHRSYTSSWSGEDLVNNTGSSTIAADIAAIPNASSQNSPIVLYADGVDAKAARPGIGNWPNVPVHNGLLPNLSLSPTIVALQGPSAPNLMAIVVDGTNMMRAYKGTTLVWNSGAGQALGAASGTVAMAALPDGGAVAAYRDSSDDLWVRFLDTSDYTWAPPNKVMMVVLETPVSMKTTKTPAVTHGIGAGASGAYVELAFIGPNNKPQHVRCTVFDVIGNKCATWTPPVQIHADDADSISLAATP